MGWLPTAKILVGRCGEGPVAVAEQDADRPVVVVGHGEILVPSPLKSPAATPHAVDGVDSLRTP